ncbi:uncharacterized protein LOC142775599 isoform X2 [Rhipicephalus microplus]|uniref:uncharacterized protein LOC142775599 isoform X2 n=1 Tax=Rhipicephalus microplus TaxID=6941 RepID=UPI003F6AF736
MLMLSLFVCIPKPFHNYLLHHTLTHLSEVHAPLDEMLRVAEDFKRRSPHFPPLFGDRRELTLGSYLRRPCRNVITMHSTTLPCMEKAIEWNPKLEWLQDSREFGLKYSNDDNSTGSEDDIDTSDFSADDESSSNRLGTSVVVHRASTFFGRNYLPAAAQRVQFQTSDDFIPEGSRLHNEVLPAQAPFHNVRPPKWMVPLRPSPQQCTANTVTDAPDDQILRRRASVDHQQSLPKHRMPLSWAATSATRRSDPARLRN